ncbi:hypothetical protein NYR62_09000 [Actinobacillus genomosp. 1]|uniref:hypothetical protein n=1 Tax=Actinobacillus genomosp. 1 TaxID=254839 RepID=UPI002442E907|nr:hypothetical protein [Actinobacillus genomosp. 1]WGE35726.1 hypothetical protein NYR62_09000 [Actinobacillus genomosp. 1]
MEREVSEIIDKLDTFYTRNRMSGKEQKVNTYLNKVIYLGAIPLFILIVLNIFIDYPFESLFVLFFLIYLIVYSITLFYLVYVSITDLKRKGGLRGIIKENILEEINISTYLKEFKDESLRTVSFIFTSIIEREDYLGKTLKNILIILPSSLGGILGFFALTKDYKITLESILSLPTAISILILLSAGLLTLRFLNTKTRIYKFKYYIYLIDLTLLHHQD